MSYPRPRSRGFHGPSAVPNPRAWPGSTAASRLACAESQPLFLPLCRRTSPSLPFCGPAPAAQFDFSILEARLLLTQFPRVAPPRISPRTLLEPHLSRILQDGGLTNGVSALKDCLYACSQSPNLPIRMGRVPGKQAGRARRDGGAGSWRGAEPSFRMIAGLDWRARGREDRAGWPSRAGGWEASGVKVGTRGREVGLGRQSDRGSHPVGGAGLDGSGSRGVAWRGGEVVSAAGSLESP